MAAADPPAPLRAAATAEVDFAGFDRFFTQEYPRLVALLTAMTGHRAVA